MHIKEKFNLEPNHYQKFHKRKQNTDVAMIINIYQHIKNCKSMLRDIMIMFGIQMDIKNIFNFQNLFVFLMTIQIAYVLFVIKNNH